MATLAMLVRLRGIAGSKKLTLPPLLQLLLLPPPRLLLSPLPLWLDSDFLLPLSRTPAFFLLSFVKRFRSCTTDSGYPKTKASTD